MRSNSLLSDVKRVSTSIFVVLLAYIWVVFSYQYVTGGLLLLWDYSAIITFNAIQGLPISMERWSKLRVTFLFGFGSITLLLQGILAWWGFFSYASGKTSLLKYWLLWFGYLSFNFVLVQFITISAGEFDTYWSLYQGPAMIASWWTVPVQISLPIGVSFTGLSIILGYVFCPLLLRFISSATACSEVASRNMFLFAHYVLPIVVTGALIIPLLSAYSWTLHVVLIANLLFMSIGALLRSEYITGIVVNRKDVLNQWSVLSAVLVVLTYFLIVFG